MPGRREMLPEKCQLVAVSQDTQGGPPLAQQLYTAVILQSKGACGSEGAKGRDSCLSLRIKFLKLVSVMCTAKHKPECCHWNLN